jgi:hypothetical protein
MNPDNIQPDELTQALADVDEYVMLLLAHREDIGDYEKIELTDEWDALYHKLHEAIANRSNTEFQKGVDFATEKSHWLD